MAARLLGRAALAIGAIALLSLRGAAAAEWMGYDDINGTLVKCHTTAADFPFVLEIKPDWAPLGAARFLALVESGYFTGVPFFRVVKDFITQFGITPDKKLRKRWREAGTIKDDPNLHMPIKRGYLSFAGAGADTRDFQFFIAYKDSNWLGKAPWEVPLGRVIFGMEEVLDKLYEVGEIHPFADKGVRQGRIWEDDAYLKREFPKLDYFVDCAVIPGSDRLKDTSARKEEEEEEEEAAAAAAAASKEEAAASSKKGEKAGQQPQPAAAAAAAAAPQDGRAQRKQSPPSSLRTNARLAAAVEERIDRARAADHTPWTLLFIVGTIAVFALLLKKLGEEKDGGKGR